MVSSLLLMYNPNEGGETMEFDRKKFQEELLQELLKNRKDPSGNIMDRYMATVISKAIEKYHQEYHSQATD